MLISMESFVTAMTIADPTPRLSTTEAEIIVRDVFALNVRATPLPSERDQNFAVSTQAGQNFVLKIAKCDEPRATLDFQNTGLEHVAKTASHLAIPRLVRSTLGAPMTLVLARDGRTYLVRMLTWLDGTLFVDATPRGREQLASLGAVLAEVDRSLQNFEHPAMHRTLHWDVKHADMAFTRTALLTSAQQTLLAPYVRAWQEVPWPALRHSVIHGDANDHNVLVRDGRVVGLIDFGDMVHSAMVCDLAIGVTYAILDQDDPIGAAADIVRAYHARNPLNAAELNTLYPLTTSRLCMSVCYAALNAKAKSGDAYQQVTAAPAWALLVKLATIPAAAVSKRFQEAAAQS